MIQFRQFFKKYKSFLVNELLNANFKYLLLKIKKLKIRLNINI